MVDFKNEVLDLQLLELETDLVDTMGSTISVFCVVVDVSAVSWWC